MTNASTSELEQPSRRYSEQAKKPKEYPDYVTYLTCFDQDEPETVQEALSGEDREEWSKAMNQEYEALMNNDTWELTDLPPGKNVVRSKWVFKLKRNSSGQIIEHKARLVAKGFSQKFGIDYFETFSPVIRFDSLRLLFALAVKYDLYIDHLDVKSAFLHANLDEEIYMKQPQNFEIKGKEAKVCRLRKALYGLKQASKAWYETNHEFFTKLGFEQLQLEPCIYVLCKEDRFLIIALFVDDSLIFYKDKTFADRVRDQIKKKFDLKDLGPVSYFLGMKVSHEPGKLKLDQTAYVHSLLQRFNMEDCKPESTPMEHNLYLLKATECANVPYQQLVGCLMFLAVTTRPDICYCVNKLSQFNICHSEEHYKYLKRVLRYLKATPDLGLVFDKEEKFLVGFVDSSFGKSHDGKSTSGFVFKMMGGAVAWASRKQTCVADSSTEAEYVAMTLAAKQASFMKHLLEELGINIEAVSLSGDNKSALKLTKLCNITRRTQHIQIKYHFIRQAVQDNLVKLSYVPSADNPADIFTKPLGRVKFQKFVNLLGLF